MDATTHILTILGVSDVERAVAFYSEAFGWERRVDVPVYVELALPDGRGVGLYERSAFASNTGIEPRAVDGAAITGTELYLRCEDLDAVIERLTALGARVLSPRMHKDWGDEVAYFADPDGNVLAVARSASID